MDIRIAEVKDLEVMVEIYNQAIVAGKNTADTTPFLTHERKEWFERHTPDHYPIFVAEDSEKVVGYLTIGPYRSGRNALRYTGEVSFFVHFKHHRQGIASNLLKYAIDMCPMLEIKTLFAILLDVNEGSVEILKKFGFEEWGHLPKVADLDGVEMGHLYYGLRIDKS